MFLQNYLQERDQFIAELGRLKGWEPEWRMMASGFSSVRVDETWRQTAADGSVSERSTSWWKHDDRELGTTVYPGGGRSDWRVEAGAYFQRWGQGPWKQVPTGPIRSHAATPSGWDVLNAWDVEPGTVRRESGGRLVFRLPRRDRAGTVELECHEGSRLVEHIRGYGVESRLTWHESRRFDHAAGRPVMTNRERRMFEPAGVVQVGECRWMFGVAASMDEALAAMVAP